MNKDLEEKIKKAKSLIGKHVQAIKNKGYAIGKMEKWNVAFKGDSLPIDALIKEHLKKHDYCVYLSYTCGDLYHYIVDYVEEYAPEFKEVVIAHHGPNVLVYADKAVIGTHVVPREKLLQIMKFQEELRLPKIEFKWESEDEGDKIWDDLYVKIDDGRWLLADHHFGTENQDTIKRIVNNNPEHWKNVK